jgi:acyl-CoA reductase-like NAD-dependent aldehyde dehydrogenase
VVRGFRPTAGPRTTGIIDLDSRAVRPVPTYDRQAVTAPTVAPTTIPAGPHPYVPRLPVPSATPVPALDRAVEEVRARAEAWIATPPEERVRLLDEVMRAAAAVAPEWARLSALHEGLHPDDPAAVEEHIVGPYLFLRGVRLHRRTVGDMARHGRPRIPGPVRTMPNGQVAARVFPVDAWDRATYIGTTGDTWMEPGVTVDGLPDTMAGAHRAPGLGRVCLVLGAGNASSIGPLDIVHKLFVENQVVVCKSHPVMAHLAAVYDAALAPLVRAGVLRLVHGSAAEGGHLAHHPGVDTLHITGADRTYEAIVYGTGPEGVERKRRDEPIIDKPFTAELGNLTPIIVVPGRWSEGDLEYHATNIATMLTNNAGFNCTTSRVIVTAAGWPQRAALMDRIRRRLAAQPPRLAYYPGARERFAAFADVHPDAELIGEAGDGHLPWMLIPDLSPDAAGDPCYRVEAFCSITAETAIDAPDAAAFLDRAVSFVNETLWGSLNATIIVDPRTARDQVTGPSLTAALERLRYGTVSLNHWSAIGYGLGVTPWGAFPGHTRADIGSGTGFVHNPLMLGRVQKTIVRSPFRARPKPIWFAGHRTAHRLLPHLIRFEADRGLRHLPAIGVYALAG